MVFIKTNKGYFMKEIILATRNKGKTHEFRQIFGSEYIIKDLHDIKIDDDIVEDGTTFVENALIKCRVIHQATGLPVLADDSGICVDALGGRPGVHTARFGGEDLNDDERNQKLLDAIKGQSDRGACYVCSLVLYFSENRFYVAQEECRGELLEAPVGDGGFGYDPIFYTPVYGKGMAEISDDEKHAISHRGKATKTMKVIIESLKW